MGNVDNEINVGNVDNVGNVGNNCLAKIISNGQGKHSESKLCAAAPLRETCVMVLRGNANKRMPQGVFEKTILPETAEMMAETGGNYTSGANTARSILHPSAHFCSKVKPSRD